jgi:hypothetical protein
VVDGATSTSEAPMTKPKSKTKVATRSAARKIRKGKPRAQSTKSAMRSDTKHAASSPCYWPPLARRLPP